MIGSCQTNVEWSDIEFNCAEPSLAQSAKMAESVEMLIGGQTCVDSRNHYYMGVHVGATW